MSKKREENRGGGEEEISRQMVGGGKINSGEMREVWRLNEQQKRGKG